MNFSVFKYLTGPLYTISRFFYICSHLNKNLPKDWNTYRRRQIRLSFLTKMAYANPEINTFLEPYRKLVKEQGDVVRSLKETNADEVELKKAINELKARKKILEEKELSFVPKELGFERARLEDLLKRRFFLDQSFSIYGGISGQYDFGPMGCSMKYNILNTWRNHFVLADNLLEVDSSILTPDFVLKASGHVERFSDLMVKDLKTGECFRLDHLIKAHFKKLISSKDICQEDKTKLENMMVKLDGYSKDEMNDLITKYNIKSPITGNDISEAIEFNLMFSTAVGPTGNFKSYLRPETAQGIFVNFKRLLDFNQGKLPFGAAQIGNSFRNEISPRSGLIRVREFTMAEIEYFVDPKNKSHPKFEQIKNMELNLFSACAQMDGGSSKKVVIDEAVNEKIIANQALAYFMARIHLFLIKVGIDPNRLRFRQHMANEMAHYACDCWDAECLTSYGWIECVGCADRSCYDLTQHSKAAKVKLVAEKMLKEPKIQDIIEVLPNKTVIGKTFKDESKEIISYLTNLSIENINELENCIMKGSIYPLKIGDKSYELKNDMVSIKKFSKQVYVEEIIPNVIEPSFGIGRIMYAIWEHNFRIREGDEERTYLTLRPSIAPIKCSILPLGNNQELVPFISVISDHLKKYDISYRIDDGSGSIGRRYSRADEIAIPYGITIDFDTLKDNTVTLREIESMHQIRLPINDLGLLINDLVMEKKNWEDVKMIYPIFSKEEK